MGRKAKDITGQKFGRLTTLYKLNNYHKKDGTYWLCVCDCGKLFEVKGGNLRSDNTKSCGCWLKENAQLQFTTHGKRNTRLYRTWNHMKSRCYNKNVKHYNDYGGRGIAVCDEWKDDFMSFYNWAMANGYDDTLTIDCIDVNGNYEPNNCRWADKKQQSRNRRNVKQITIDDKTHCLSEWCEILGLNSSTVRTRIYSYDWDVKRALDLEERK